MHRRLEPPARRRVVKRVEVTYTGKGGWLTGLLAALALLVSLALVLLFSLAFLFVLIPVALLFATFLGRAGRRRARPREGRIIDVTPESKEGGE